MTEIPQPPEAKTPYYEALDDFYTMLTNNTATEEHIRFALAKLLSETTHPSANRQMYIDNWSQRHSYDVEGILLDEPQDERDELPETDDIIHKKLALLSDVTAFLVASEHTTVTDDQKIELLERATHFFEKRGKGLDDIQRLLGSAVAPHLAFNIEMVAQGDNTEERRRRGKMVLNAMTGRWLIRSSLGPVFRNNMRAAVRASKERGS